MNKHFLLFFILLLSFAMVLVPFQKEADADSPITFVGWIKFSNGDTLPNGTLITLYETTNDAYTNTTVNNHLSNANYLVTLWSSYGHSVIVNVSYEGFSDSITVVVASGVEWANLTITHIDIDYTDIVNNPIQAIWSPYYDALDIYATPIAFIFLLGALYIKSGAQWMTVGTATLLGAVLLRNIILKSTIFNTGFLIIVAIGIASVVVLMFRRRFEE